MGDGTTLHHSMGNIMRIVLAVCLAMPIIMATKLSYSECKIIDHGDSVEAVCIGETSTEVRQKEPELRRRTKENTEPQSTYSAPNTVNSGVVESQIDGSFEGWSGETIFRLVNGQIWQQSSYAYTYHYSYRPKVIIYISGGSYKLKVDGVSSTINVTRLE